MVHLQETLSNEEHFGVVSSANAKELSTHCELLFLICQFFILEQAEVLLAKGKPAVSYRANNIPETSQHKGEATSPPVTKPEHPHDSTSSTKQHVGLEPEASCSVKPTPAQSTNDLSAAGSSEKLAVKSSSSQQINTSEEHDENTKSAGL